MNAAIYDQKQKPEENGFISCMNDKKTHDRTTGGIIDDEEEKKRLLAEELRARKVMIEDFEGIIHDVIPEIDVYDVIEEVLGWRI